MRTVAVALSGGVDSAVAAALCVESGLRVFGLMLRLWSDPAAGGENRCCPSDALAAARSVAGSLGIPFRVIDASEPFKRHVVDAFLAGTTGGATPNPCLACNRRVRFGYLLERAMSQGADALVTGHYARTELGPDGRWRLLRGVDPAKDQSYVLSVLGPEQLGRVWFPLGGWTKAEVRRAAVDRDLAVARRPESVDLCWVGADGLSGFLERHLPGGALEPGPVVTPDGRVLGRHRGLGRYTIGQRRGLGVAIGQARYVLAKDVAANALVVGDEARLYARRVLVREWHWVAGAPPGPGPWDVEAQTRYRASASRAVLEPWGEDGVVATFACPQRAPTPGQALVAYEAEACLGGGIVVRSEGR